LSSFTSSQSENKVKVGDIGNNGSTSVPHSSPFAQPPLFTIDELTMCIDKAIKAHEEKMNNKFEQVLNERLQGLRLYLQF
jgi:hypothetical protein